MTSGLITPDLILLSYILILTTYLINRREKTNLHSIDTKFILVILPYIILTALTSSSFVTSHNPLKHLILTSTAVTILAGLMIKIENRKKAYILEAFTGITALSIIWISLKPALDFLLLSQIIILALIPSIPIFFLPRTLKKKARLFFIFPVSTHFLDAASTVIALEKGLQESRALARIFIEYLGSYGVFAMKALFIIPISYYLVKEIDEGISKEALYMIGVYGLVLGLRNYFLML